MQHIHYRILIRRSLQDNTGNTEFNKEYKLNQGINIYEFLICLF